MKHNRLALAIVGIVISWAGVSHAAPPHTRVAVLDLKEVFEHHLRLQKELQSIQADVKAFEEKVRTQQANVGKLSEQLNALRPGTPDYRKLEQTIAQRAANAAAGVQLKKKDVIEREANVYLEAYNEVLRIVGQIARQNQIGIVLRYDSRAVDPADVNSVARALNKGVLFHDNLDITSLVLQQLNGTAQRVPDNTPRVGAGNSR